MVLEEADDDGQIHFACRLPIGWRNVENSFFRAFRVRTTYRSLLTTLFFK